LFWFFSFLGVLNDKVDRVQKHHQNQQQQQMQVLMKTYIIIREKEIVFVCYKDLTFPFAEANFTIEMHKHNSKIPA